MRTASLPISHQPLPQRQVPREVDIYVEDEECDVIVISDLHIGEGYLRWRRAYARGENFFEDEAFRNFLRYLGLEAAERRRPLKLVINGDFLDFVRARSLPNDREREVFRRYFRRLGLTNGRDGFEINPLEGKYGLKTEEHKSVWKLHRICDGHPLVFVALAEFLAHGNKLVLIKGNHDLEFYWPAVQTEFIKLLAAELPTYNGRHQSARDRFMYVQERVEFSQRAYVIENQIYIEHGHQYQPMTRTERALANDHELWIPPGSIFNRYLVNSLERIVPLIANIRPHFDIVRLLANSDRLRALRIMLHYLPVAVRMLTKRYLRFSLALFLNVLPYVFGIFYALFGIFLPAVWKTYGLLLARLSGAAGAFLINNWFLNLAFCFLLFHLLCSVSRLIGRNLEFRLEDALSMALRRMSQTGDKAKFIVLGHTHRATVEPLKDNYWYVNSGTWIPIIDRKHTMLRERTTLSYLIFWRGAYGFDFDLRVWKDHKGKSERLVILE